MKIRKLMPVTVEPDYRENRKSGRRGHRRITIPEILRNYIDVEKGDWIEWELDTKTGKLIGRFIKDESKNNKKQ